MASYPGFGPLGQFNPLSQNAIRAALLAAPAFIPPNIKHKFQRFLTNLSLSEQQRNAAVANARSVALLLNQHYYGVPLMSPGVLNIVGSYLKGTAISPPSDIDMLFLLPSNQFQRFDTYDGNGQSYLLQEVRGKLLKTYSRTEIRADGQIVLVPFSSYCVEIVPCFRGDNETFWLPDTNDGGRWKATCPTAERALVLKSNVRSKGNTINLIKMMKAWKKYCNVDITSFVLELRVVYFMEKWEHFEKDAFWYDFIVRDFFKELLNYVNATCVVPGTTEKIQYGDQWKSKVESAYARADKACTYVAEGKLTLACEEYKKIFGNNFPA